MSLLTKTLFNQESSLIVRIEAINKWIEWNILIGCLSNLSNKNNDQVSNVIF